MMTPLWSAPLSSDQPKKMFASLTEEQKKFYGSEQFFADSLKEARDLVHLVGG